MPLTLQHFTMDINSVTSVVALLSLIVTRHNLIRNKKRQFWVHPCLELRIERGKISTTFGDLLKYDDCFKKNFRMTKESFLKLFERIYFHSSL